MPPSPLCLVGEVIVDVFLDPAGSPHIRLGGVLHAARALSALRSAFAIGAVLPAYLTQEARQATAAYGATAFQIVGQVTGAPNVLLIPEPTEAGNQRYELLMRNTAVTDLDLRVLDTLLAEQKPSDVLVFPGSYDLAGVLQILGRRACRVHVDAAYGVDDPAPLKALGRPLDTFIISTSSRLFTDRYAGTPSRLVADIVPAHARALLLKENRGGSRLFSSSGTISCPAQMSSTRHSVGVGDCFDAVFVAKLPDVGDRAALQYAACLAAEYAATFDLVSGRPILSHRGRAS